MPLAGKISTTVCALNADVVGYSRLLADDFDATSTAMAGARAIVDRQVADHRGTLVNFVGDNFMAVFDRSIDGVHAAIGIAADLESANDGFAADRRLRFRMGLDRGEVSVSGGHYEGDALNVAARIQALAPAGGLSVSGAVFRELDEPRLRFRPTGSHRLKNIPEAVEIYEFVDLPSDGGPRVESRLSLEIPSIAVLPIHTEDVSAETASVASVIRADIVHRLAAIPELHVIDADTLDPSAVEGRAARYFLETGVHQFGPRLRLHATVFDVTTVNVVKSHRVLTTLDDILEVSESFADDVGRGIEVELVVGAPAGLYAELDDPAAIEKVYRGWYHLRSETRDGWFEARNLFEAVAESHPDQPFGWVLAAFANWLGAAYYGWAPDPSEALATAREQARQGIAVGDPTGMGRTVDAAVMMSLGQVDEAIAALEDIDIVRPTCDVTYALEGSIKRYLGEWEQAVDLLDVAMGLTGINKPWYPTVKACSLLIGNRFEQAASVAEEVLEYQPNNVEALLVLAASQRELGLDRRAEATAARLREAHPSLDVGRWMDRNPYRDPALTERWRADLAALDLIPTG